MNTTAKSGKDRVVIFDTTLRDGEQCPGATMTHEEKIEVAELLDTMGVDIIEAGFPIASPGDFEAVREISKTLRGPIICGLARCNDADIDRAWEALQLAARARIHVFLATSAIHREFKLKMDKDEIVRRAVAGVKRAASYTPDVEFSPEDAGRSDIDFLCRIIEAAIKAGVSTIMPSFNDVAGIPMTAHGELLNDLCRKQWGFDGVMVSDYTAVVELIAHGIAEDVPHAASLALNAGVDIDMQDQAYVQGLPKALERGLVTMADIDRAVRRVLLLKAKLGLFDEPYRRVSAPPLSDTQVKEFTALARDSARRSVVLLKNDNNALPLSAKNKTIALIGPLADAPLEMFGCWFAAAPLESATILHGLRTALPDSDIRHVNGVEIEGGDTNGISEAVALAKASDTIILSLGETKDMTGEAHSRGRIELPGHQRALAEAIFALGKPVIVVLSHGRPIAAPWLFEKAEAVVASWFLGSEAGHGIADVMTGKWNPSAKLCVTWPYDGGQIPIFHSQRPTGRPANPEVYFSTRHVDLPIEPQFPFGHGLSYTRYALSNLKVQPEFAEGDNVAVTVDVSNEGAVAGEETLFLFLRDPVASVARPVLELKGFAKAILKPGERKTVRFTLKPSDFEFLDRNLKPRFEPGVFEISVGQSADRTKILTAKVQGKAR